ncbi:MAG: hypothetical protein Q9Q13_12520 [Acidobacteriota bacterium]|nr:hypothetical protein [Acidobacteriota bacterium]
MARFEPSTVTGPRLENQAVARAEVTAATVKTSGEMAGGSFTVLQLGPSLPAAATIQMPARRSLARASSKTWVSQPSDGGQPQELFTTWGAISGRPSVKGSPPGG